MNDKIQAILLKVVIALKRLQWKPTQDWEITLKSEQYASLVKPIEVVGALNDKQWKDVVDTFIQFKLYSLQNDDITFFPKCGIYTKLHIPGLQDTDGDEITEDIAEEMSTDVAFTGRDINNTEKIDLAAQKINRAIEEFIKQKYDDFVTKNAEELQYSKDQQSGRGSDRGQRN